MKTPIKKMAHCKPFAVAAPNIVSLINKKAPLQFGDHAELFVSVRRRGSLNNYSLNLNRNKNMKKP